MIWMDTHPSTSLLHNFAKFENGSHVLQYTPVSKLLAPCIWASLYPN